MTGIHVSMAAMVLLPFALWELDGWSPHVAERVMRWSAKRLGDPAYQVRYEEEYLANLALTPSGLAQLTMAVWCALMTPALRRTLRRTGLERLLRAHRADRPDADLAVIRAAHRVAERCHRGQVRKSGDAYISHPVAVALILTEYHADSATVTAALLHDTVEDTDYTLEELTVHFGPDVAHLVDGMAALSGEPSFAIAQVDTPNSNAGRILLIKAADRLHNLRTIQYVDSWTQRRTAQHTLDLLPAIGRLGLSGLTRELEERARKILDAT
jgi:(p)ppGpp synthase/HD superfamily hydrolase